MLLTQFDQGLSTEQSNAFLTELALLHADQIQTVAARDFIRACLATGDYRALCDFRISYEELPVLDALHLRQCIAFFAKRDDIDFGIDKEKVAFEKFESAERLCKETNQIFRAHAAGKFVFSPYVEGVLHAAQRKIARVLGPVPSLSQLKIRFGKGATTAVQKRNACSRNKLRAGIQCSHDLEPVLEDCLYEIPDWLEQQLNPDTRSEGPQELENYLGAGSLVGTIDVQIVPGKLAFVPKTALTHRSIGVEPCLNSMFQLGIGQYMDQCLAAVGIDLHDQTRNQRMARYGSLTGELATLDLSSASDTIATELVAHLLPIDWFLFLSRFRTSKVSYKGRVIRLEKFSSMGNGFTFPLETLIFWALSSSAVKTSHKTDILCTAYGDDIIVPSDTYSDVSHVLFCCGFVLNPEKSFASGPFRESCGADYYCGSNIRPFYQRSRVSGETLLALHNFYVRNGLTEFATQVLSHIGTPLKKWGPDGYGDGHLLGDWVARPHRRNLEWGGSIFETYTWRAKRQFRRIAPGDRALPTYSIYAGSSDSKVEEVGPPECIPGSYLSEWAKSLPSGGSRFIYDKKGRLGCSMPGRDQYKLIQIYTLES